MRKDDLEMLREVKLFLRSILAFLLFMRASEMDRKCFNVYEMADWFIAQLEEDLSA